ncbi:MAG: hypothetical protein GXP43_01565 [bacterium]|nr:hypothetical protein [bacterium]
MLHERSFVDAEEALMSTESAFSPWALVFDFVSTTGGGEWSSGEMERFVRANGLGPAEARSFNQAVGLLTELWKLNGSLDTNLNSVEGWLGIRKLMLGYKNLLSGLDFDDIPWVLSGLEVLNTNGLGSRVGLLRTLPRAMLARLVVVAAEYGMMGFGLLNNESNRPKNGLLVFGLLLASLGSLSYLERMRLREGRWVTSAGAQMLQAAFGRPGLAVAMVRIGPLIRGLVMSMNQVSQQSILLFSATVGMQAALTAMLSLWDEHREQEV